MPPTTATDAALAGPATCQAVPISKIVVIDNPRSVFDHDAMVELQTSIAEHGIIEPLVCRRLTGDQYELICGERRLRAARAIGLATVPAMVHEGLSDGATLAMRVIENIHRRDLNPIEEARGIADLKNIGYSQREIAAKLHRSEPAISNALRLLRLEDPIQWHIATGRLTAAHGLELLGYQDVPGRLRLADQFAKSGGSVVSLRYEIDWLLKSERAVAKQAAELSSTKPATTPAPSQSTQSVRPAHVPEPVERPATTEPDPYDPSDRPDPANPPFDVQQSGILTDAAMRTLRDIEDLLITAHSRAAAPNLVEVDRHIYSALNRLRAVIQQCTQANATDPQVHEPVEGPEPAAVPNPPPGAAPLHTLPNCSIIALVAKPHVKAVIMGVDLDAPDGPLVNVVGFTSGRAATITPAEAHLWRLADQEPTQ